MGTGVLGALSWVSWCSQGERTLPIMDRHSGNPKAGKGGEQAGGRKEGKVGITGHGTRGARARSEQPLQLGPVQISCYLAGLKNSCHLTQQLLRCHVYSWMFVSPSTHFKNATKSALFPDNAHLGLPQGNQCCPRVSRAENMVAEILTVLPSCL